MSQDTSQAVSLQERRLAVSPAAIVARRLSLHTLLHAQALATLIQLLGRPTKFAADTLIAKTGDPADRITILHDGFACRMSVLPDGRRQIHSVLLPGDTIDAETSLLGVRPDNIEVLTPATAWLVPRIRLKALLQTEPLLAEAFARETAIAAQVAREWVVNIGQRTALERIAHLICELYARLGAVDLIADAGFLQPLTQVEIGDAQGLSAVHVNRVMKQLRAQGLIRTQGRQLRVLDMPGLRKLALFDPLYLHLLHKAA